MDIVIEICKWITIILACFTTPLMIWMIITTVVGFFKVKDLTKKEDKQHNFAVIICARNEETVIPQLIDSLKKQDYANYKCFVIADNCTDKTAEVSAQQGAVVYERFSETEKGKGFALSFGINKIMQDYNNEFDAICVFDADNLAHPSFLKEMNNALCSGEVAIGYRDSKNIHDSWVSECYYIYWLMLMRFYHASRFNMGLSSMVGGTGFAFKTSILGEEGWKTHSLTEDVEFSIQQILKGNHIIPARKAIFYDEQPVTFGVSVKQRLRWMIGGMQCIPLYMPSIMKSLFKGNIKALDLAWYVLFIPAAGLTLPLNIASIISMPLVFGLPQYTILLVLSIIAVNVVLPLIVSTSTLILEKRNLKGMLRGVLTYPIFIISMMFISVAAMIHPKTEWKPIEHKSKCTIDDMKV